MTRNSTFQTLRRALKGEHGDFTQGGISDAVILLAIPMILELSLESVFAVVDMFFVSPLGQNAIAIVGLTESVVTIVYSASIGISTAAGAIVARRIGEKNIDGAAHAGAQSLGLALVLALVLSGLGIWLADDILGLMGASPEVVAQGTNFARILLGGSPVIVLLFLINGIFRGAGDAAMAMKSLWVANALNILLCPFLIHLFGLEGAAITTVIGRGTGVLYQSYHLFRGAGVLKFRRSHFTFDLPIVKSISKIAWPASIQFLVGSGSWILLTRLIAETGGTAASAGYQISFRIFVFFILPAWGLSNAAATLVGQNLGAKNVERAEASVWVTTKYNMGLMALVSILLTVLAPQIVGVFTTDPAVLGHGTTGLRILGSGFVFYGIAMVLSQALNGAGDTRTPTLINIFCFWVVETPLAYLLAKGFSMGAPGVMISVPVAHGLMALIAWVIFRRGAWKTIKV